jgi:VWFA-related protein
MGLVAAIALLAGTVWAQFKSTVPLVVAPTTVTDAKGQYVDGLTTADLILYDNDGPQPTQMDWMKYPIDLVVAVQTSTNSKAVIDKLGGSGILFTQLLAADAGKTAVISFSDEVKVQQEFTGKPDLVIHSLRVLRKEGNDAHVLDAMRQATLMLEQRPPARRRIILMIAEKRDRSSRVELSDAMKRVQRLNAAVYWLTYSPFLEPFTVEPKAAEDLRPEPQRIFPIGELSRLREPDLSSLFTNTTGGRALNFLKKNTLEQAIQVVGEEVHRQYILSFEPKSDDSGKFHVVRVAVKNRPDLRVKTRSGYWPSQ